MGWINVVLIPCRWTQVLCLFQLSSSCYNSCSRCLCAQTRCAFALARRTWRRNCQRWQRRSKSSHDQKSLSRSTTKWDSCYGEETQIRHWGMLLVPVACQGCDRGWSKGSRWFMAAFAQNVSQDTVNTVMTAAISNVCCVLSS